MKSDTIKNFQRGRVKLCNGFESQEVWEILTEIVF